MTTTKDEVPERLEQLESRIAQFETALKNTATFKTTPALY
jgi:hypothetical protein